MTTTKTLSIEETLTCSVDALPLSIRGSNVLKSQGVETIRDLVNSDARVLLVSPNCGKKTIAEIVACLKMTGLKMENSDGMFPDDVIEGHIASIRKYRAELSEPMPNVETFHDKQAKEIKLKQHMGMLMRANGADFSSIAKEIGRSVGTARFYFTQFCHALVRESKKRGLTVAEILTEKNIPLAAIDLMSRDGIVIRG